MKINMLTDNKEPITIKSPSEYNQGYNQKDDVQSFYEEQQQNMNAFYQQQQNDTRAFYERQGAEEKEVKDKSLEEEKYRHSPNDGDNSVSLADKWVHELQMSGPQHASAHVSHGDLRTSELTSGMNQYYEPRQPEPSLEHEIELPGRGR